MTNLTGIKKSYFRLNSSTSFYYSLKIIYFLSECGKIIGNSVDRKTYNSLKELKFYVKYVTKKYDH